MRRPAWGALLGGALALAGCTGAGRTPAAAPARLPIVILAGADVAVSARLVAARARDAEVIYLGELHDNPLHHAIQTRILEALLLDGRRPALAFEMDDVADRSEGTGFDRTLRNPDRVGGRRPGEQKCRRKEHR